MIAAAAAQTATISAGRQVTNIQWLKDWLRSFMKTGGTVIATSHDTGFLNEMCDAIVDFQDRKLRQFRGNKGTVLKEFVEAYPEKEGYFKLKNDVHNP